MYTPSFIKKEFQYTQGDAFMLSGQPYIGYYNVNIQGTFTDKIYTDKSIKLYPLEFVLNEQGQRYQQLADDRGLVTDQEFSDPMYFRPSTTRDDFKRGYIARYFIQQRNDINGKVLEVGKPQYELLSDQAAGLNPNYYKSVQLRWKLTGPREDIMKDGLIYTPGVVGTNNRTITEKDNILRGIYNRLNTRLDQFSIYDSTINTTNTDIEL